jgi:hypothetical protein
MKINEIVDRINHKLAGEMLSYDELKYHIDEAIDDINSKLSAKFPAITEFNATDFPQYPDYNFFPNNYIRSVVVIGVSEKFYLTDEEGASASLGYTYAYKDRLFEMQRDYSSKVPLEYQDLDKGYVVAPAAYSYTPQDIPYEDVFAYGGEE